MHYHFDPDDRSSLFKPCHEERCAPRFGMSAWMSLKGIPGCEDIPEPGHGCCNSVPEDDDNIDDYSDDLGRTLIESGDYGYSGSGNYPHVHDPLWLAINGHSKADHLRHMEAIAEKGSEYLIKGHYAKMPLAGRKRGKALRLESRKYQITTVSLTDPDILPRNMSAEDFTDIYSGVAFANASLGAILNVHVTFNWRDLGYRSVPGEEAPLYNEFIRHFTDWCDKRSLPCVWIYSNESSSTVGLHSHFLASVPKDKLREFERWLQKRKVKINRSNVFDRKACDLAKETAWNTDVQWLRVQYLCKGIDQNALIRNSDGQNSIRAADLIAYNYQCPGDVVCKRRCGLSGNIRESARREVGFLSDLEKGYLNVDLLYSDKEGSIRIK